MVGREGKKKQVSWQETQNITSFLKSTVEIASIILAE